VCLLLGTGGLGCSVAIGLARMGVKKLILLDRDVVDIHNLNRQILFNREDVGKSKVKMAEESLKRSHVVSERTSIESHHMCAL
jgi:molybdopterin/thiamine biosynthesis adenylyltransferase